MLNLTTDRPSSPVAADSLSTILADFQEPPPSLLSERSLLRRVDSKFIAHQDTLDRIMPELQAHYAALRVPTGFVARYHNQYLDLPGLRYFHDHRRGRRVRHKVRFRHYPDRLLSFLEVKTKRNALVTDKHRIAVDYQDETLAPTSLAFLSQHLGAEALALAPSIRINYRRISLFGLHSHERATIDFDLQFISQDNTAYSVGPLVIFEVKQAQFSLATPIMRALSAARIRRGSISKYAVAIATAHPKQRSNRFLPSIKRIERIAQCRNI